MICRGSHDKMSLLDPDEVTGCNRSVIGDAPRRREDARFVTGAGAYLDDLRFDGLAHAVRAALAARACADRRASTPTAARAMPGVLAVLTGADAARRRAAADAPDGGSQRADRRALRLRAAAAAGDRQGAPCRRAGGADRRRDARPGAGCGRAHRDRLDAAAGRHHAPMRRCAAGAPQITDEVPGNVCLDWHWGDAAGVDAAFAAAAHVVSLRLDNHRIVTNPMEPRGAVGSYDAAADRYTLHRLQPEHPRQSRRHAPAPSASRPRPCGSSHPMSAAASARRTSPMPSTR